MYLSIFLSALLAATLLPAQSEAVLAYGLLSAPEGAFILVCIATAGNVIGSVLNWAIGKFAMRFQTRPWFPVSGKQITKAEHFYARYGRYSLLLSWVPFIGDPITIVAGMLREPFISFIFLVTLAKAARYIVLAAIILGMWHPNSLLGFT